MMKPQWTQRWAKLLVHYSLGVKEGEEIKVRGGVAAADLVRAVVVEILRAGAFPRVNVGLPEMSELVYSHASDAQLSHCSKIDLHEARSIDGMISIRAETNTRAMNKVPPSKQVLTTRAARKITDIIINKDRWVATLFPTAAYAQDADMSTSDFESFVARAMFLTRSDPVGAWRELSARQDSLRTRLDAATTVRIVGDDTDLSLSIAGRTAINSDGTHNMPSGEVFTAPVENSAEGYITYTYPVVAYGREISGIRLEFSGGKVVKACARKNESFLRKMLDTDNGARRLGELGIGTNYGIRRFVKNILFDEKIGGSVHLAVGKSYPQCGGKNASALHWDMIKDLRRGGKLYFDNVLVQKDGKFLDT